MNKTKRGDKIKIGSAMGALATKECCSLQQALAAHKGHHAGIHDTRRSCRRLRSMLAFLPISTDSQQVKTLDKALQQLMRSFSELRDAHVVTRTARLLANSHSATLTPALIGLLESRCMAMLDAALEQDPEWRRRRSKAERIAATLETLDWQSINPSSAKEALKRSIKRMKKARRIALEERTDVACHRWRRRTRQVRYQLEFLRKARHMAGLKKSRAQQYDARIKQLGLITDRLGWRQDFQMFLATLDQWPASADVQALRDALTQKSAALSKTSPAKAGNSHAHAKQPSPSTH
jgi:CHAD domain-containing protein